MSAPNHPLQVASDQSSPPLPQRVDSRELFQGNRVLEIEHAGQCYQLRLTRENKLILTK